MFNFMFNEFNVVVSWFGVFSSSFGPMLHEFRDNHLYICYAILFQVLVSLSHIQLNNAIALKQTPDIVPFCTILSLLLLTIVLCTHFYFTLFTDQYVYHIALYYIYNIVLTFFTCYVVDRHLLSTHNQPILIEMNGRKIFYLLNSNYYSV